VEEKLVFAGRPAPPDDRRDAAPRLHAGRIRLFADRIGVDKSNSRVSMELLEDAIRDDLNKPRSAGDGRPAASQGDDHELAGRPGEWLEIPLWPRDIGKEGTRKVPLTSEIRSSGPISRGSSADWRSSPRGERCG